VQKAGTEDTGNIKQQDLKRKELCVNVNRMMEYYRDGAITVLLLTVCMSVTWSQSVIPGVGEIITAADVYMYSRYLSEMSTIIYTPAAVN